MKSKYFQNNDLDVGDTVIVDGKYEAEIIWLGQIFAQIKKGEKQWDIVRKRLTKCNKSK